MPKNNLTSKVLVLVGPTSSGKTSLALEICKKTGAEIISSDSRQVYRYMDIGTGKLPGDADVKVTVKDGVWQLNGIPIYGYNLTDPDHYFSGYDLAFYALKKARELLAQNKKIIIVGGGGFYSDLITGRLKLDRNAPDFDLRESLEKENIEQLQTKLSQLNPSRYAEIDKNNKPRLVRAVEHELSEKKHAPLPYLENTEFVYFGLTAPREHLYARVDKWVDKVWVNGLLEETKFLLKKFPTSSKLRGHVYSTATAFLKNELDEQTAIQRTKWDLHAYIRRQFTWLKRNEDISWLDIKKLTTKECILAIIKAVYG